MEECCAPKRNVKAFCPECGKQGKPVQKITLESLLKDPEKTGERVGIKETEDPIPLCYCFGWDRKRIWDEINTRGKSTAAESITKEVKAGNCFCERSNPRGLAAWETFRRP